ncbi:MAG TPA: hypothetical protein DD417_15815 [Elusimicrobia bacterium]|nr:hypothetical protein [Elusimicrobiota bacterium]
MRGYPDSGDETPLPLDAILRPGRPPLGEGGRRGGGGQGSLPRPAVRGRGQGGLRRPPPPLRRVSELAGGDRLVPGRRAGLSQGPAQEARPGRAEPAPGRVPPADPAHPAPVSRSG